MTRPPAPSESKSALVKHLNCSEAHYSAMLAEANVGRDNLSGNPDNLAYTPNGNRSYPPYRWDQLSETSRHRETLAIKQRASPGTRYYYDKGQTFQNIGGQVVEENWVIRWFLWHSFRYRDNRDPNYSSSSTQGYQGAQQRPSSFWDPVRSSN